MRSSAGEHLVHTEGVTGSIPVASTNLPRGPGSFHAIARADQSRLGRGCALDAERSGLNHGDFREAHLLLTHDADRMAGIIDFGDAVHGDPARDFTFFWSLADWAAPFALAAYGPVADPAGILERSRWSFIRYSASRMVLALTTTRITTAKPWPPR